MRFKSKAAISAAIKARLAKPETRLKMRDAWVRRRQREGRPAVLDYRVELLDDLGRLAIDPDLGDLLKAIITRLPLK